jgi:hypothetical protein
MAVAVSSCGGGDTSGPQPGAPSIQLERSTVELTGRLGATVPSTQLVRISNDGTGTLNGLSVSAPSYSGSHADWLAVTLSSAQVPATVQISASVQALPIGTHVASVTVSSTAEGLTGGSRTITVSFTVIQEPAIAVSVNSVVFDAIRGAPTPPARVVSVFNSGTGALDGITVDPVSYAQGQAGGWLTASLDGATAPATLTVSANPGSLAVGVYSAVVTLRSTASGVTNSPRSISVQFIVARPPTIALSAGSATFAGQRLSANPPNQTLAVTNSGTGTLDQLSVMAITYGAGQPGGWLTAALDRTVAPAVLTLSASTASVPSGSYSATVTLASAAALVPGTEHVAVVFNVAAAPPRLMVLEAPTSGVTGVRLAQAVRIRVLDGEVDAPLLSYASPITASLSISGALAGKLTAFPASGEATFDSLVVNAAGTFPIRFDAPGAVRVTSPITAAPLPGGTLVARAPTNQVFEDGGIVRINPALEIRDAAGVLVAYPVQARVAFFRGSGAVLSGDTTTSAAGLATFPALRIAARNETVTLEYSAPGFAPTTRDQTLFGAVWAMVPARVNNADSVVARGNTFHIDIAVSGNLQVAPLGSARFDVHWDPSLLMFESDSTLMPNVTLAVNRTDVANGVFAASAALSSGFPLGSRVIRMRFKVVATAPATAIITTPVLEARSTTDVVFRNLIGQLQLRIP